MKVSASGMLHLSNLGFSVGSPSFHGKRLTVTLCKKPSPLWVRWFSSDTAIMLMLSLKHTRKVNIANVGLLFFRVHEANHK